MASRRRARSSSFRNFLPMIPSYGEIFKSIRELLESQIDSNTACQKFFDLLSSYLVQLVFDF